MFCYFTLYRALTRLSLLPPSPSTESECSATRHRNSAIMSAICYNILFANTATEMDGAYLVCVTTVYLQKAKSLSPSLSLSIPSKMTNARRGALGVLSVLCMLCGCSCAVPARHQIVNRLLAVMPSDNSFLGAAGSVEATAPRHRINFNFFNSHFGRCRFCFVFCRWFCDCRMHTPTHAYCHRVISIVRAHNNTWHIGCIPGESECSANDQSRPHWNGDEQEKKKKYKVVQKKEGNFYEDQH